MSIDLRTVAITPLRQTFDHVARRFGDKPASRYQEGTYDVQPVSNFHYRPTWAPQYEIFDQGRTALVMQDWYAFKDPRQFYYGTYTLARAKMQETAEADFSFVEDRGLADTFDEGARSLSLEVLLPLRHVAWGSNLNNASVAAYAYGTAFTQPCLFHSMDQLGIAQYLTRLGLLLGTPATLDDAKQAWLGSDVWQPLRRYVEDMFVLKDPIELWTAQNVALDGLLYPLVYDRFDNRTAAKAGPTVSMLLRFQSEWFAETTKWVDACLKVAAGESAANAAVLSAWFTAWRDRAAEALAPVADLALDKDGADELRDIVSALNARASKAGLTVEGA